MNIIQITDSGIQAAELPKPTAEELQNEYNYILAEQMTRNLLNMGLISDDEFNKIMQKNQRTFSPYFSRIIGNIT